MNIITVSICFINFCIVLVIGNEFVSFCRITLNGLCSSLRNLGNLNKYIIMGKHEELMAAVHRADVTAVSKLLAKYSGSKSSTFYCKIFI